MAFDLTCFATLKAKIKSSIILWDADFFETSLIFLFNILKLFISWCKVPEFTDLKEYLLFSLSLDESIIIKFFLIFKTSNVFLLILGATISSKKLRLISLAIFVSMLLLNNNIPPKALIGSACSALL